MTFNDLEQTFKITKTMYEFQFSGYDVFHFMNTCTEAKTVGMTLKVT